MTLLAARGISIDLPPGWDGQIRSPGPPDGAAAPFRAAGAGAVPPGEASILHAASFPLPAERGDYGSGAVEVMAGSDILICLLEHEAEAAGTALFRHDGLPRLTPASFSPEAMQRAVAGMAGSQQFFQVGGRPFCLYVVVGSWRTRGPLVRAADDVVRTIDIAS